MYFDDPEDYPQALIPLSNPFVKRMRTRYFLRCLRRYGHATIIFLSAQARDARAAELMHDGYTVVIGVEQH